MSFFYTKFDANHITLGRKLLSLLRGLADLATEDSEIHSAPLRVITMLQNVKDVYFLYQQQLVQFDNL